jgi:hypothetical protein
MSILPLLASLLLQGPTGFTATPDHFTTPNGVGAVKPIWTGNSITLVSRGWPVLCGEPPVLPCGTPGLSGFSYASYSILVGTTPLPFPLPVPPTYSGPGQGEILFEVVSILPGTLSFWGVGQTLPDAIIQVPNDPALIGQVFYLQLFYEYAPYITGLYYATSNPMRLRLL